MASFCLGKCHLCLCEALLYEVETCIIVFKGLLLLLRFSQCFYITISQSNGRNGRQWWTSIEISLSLIESEPYLCLDSDAFASMFPPRPGAELEVKGQYQQHNIQSRTANICKTCDFSDKNRSIRESSSIVRKRHNSFKHSIKINYGYLVCCCPQKTTAVRLLHIDLCLLKVKLTSAVISRTVSFYIQLASCLFP